MNFSKFGLGLFVALLISPQPGWSESPERPSNLLTQRFTLMAGGYFSFSATEIQLNNRRLNQDGTNVDLENDLGLDSFVAKPYGEARWRINPKNRIELEFLALDRDGDAQASRQLSIGDLVVPIGVTVDSKVDLALARLTYGYSFINDGKTELGVLVGAHVANVDYNVSVTGSAGQIGGVTSSGSDFTTPLPHVGVLGGFAVSDDLVLNARLIGFYLEIDDYSGWLLEADAKVTYMIWENLGVGVGARYFRFNLDGNSSRFDGTLDFRFVGPTAFAVIAF